jgi:hypothetical protein
MPEAAEGDLDACLAGRLVDGKKVESECEQADEDQANDLDPDPPLRKQAEHDDRQCDRRCGMG